MLEWNTIVLDLLDEWCLVLTGLWNATFMFCTFLCMV